MWNRFTERARQIVFRAQEAAGRQGTPYVTPEHLLIGMTVVEGNMGLRILDALGLPPLELREEIEAQLSPGDGQTGQDLMLTPRAKGVVDFAFEAARDLKHDYIGGEHLLLGLLREGESTAAAILAKHGITVERVTEQLQQLRDNDARALAETKAEEELLSLDDAAQFLGTSKPTLYRVLGQGELKGLKVGRQWRFRKADLVAYMERGPVAAAPASDLDAAIASLSEQLHQAKSATAPSERKEDQTPESSPSQEDAETKTVRLTHRIIQLAIAMHASDVHLDPAQEEGANFLRLRYRVDGALHEAYRLAFSVQDALTARFKIMADMNVAEKRVPQDGRMPVRHEGKDFDLRVATVPSVFGESIVMRILLKNDVVPGLGNLGLTDDDLDQIRGLIHQPNGLLIATGPAGSGKTALMYSCLQDIAGIGNKTISIEDPIELPMPLVTQVEVNKHNGVTVAGALRSFMRQDPDIIFVSDTQEAEIAHLAAEASLTGHLVLTTMHTNDAPSALSRLLDMGLPPYLVAATVSGIVAQRLCRKLCDNCKEAYQVPARDLLRFGLEPDDPAQTITLYRGKGCDQCRHRGYRGRTGLFELLLLTDEIADLIVKGAGQAEIAAAARAAGMNNLWQDGLLKVLDGVTTPDEVLRVCMAV